MFSIELVTFLFLFILWTSHGHAYHNAVLERYNKIVTTSKFSFIQDNKDNILIFLQPYFSKIDCSLPE